jgi:hypothetical protein
MKIIDISFIACRVLALCFLCQSFSFIGTGLLVNHFYINEVSRSVSMNKLSEVWAIINFLIFLIMWFLSGFIARRMSGDKAATEVSTNMSAADLQSALFAFVGLILITQVITGVSIELGSITYLGMEEVDWLNARQVKIILECCIGIYLLLGANSLTKILNKFRKW